MTFGSSSHIWLNLAGTEPDLYFPSIASATTGSCSPPEVPDSQLMIVQQLSQLAINDESPGKNDSNESEPTYAVWEKSSFMVDDYRFMSPEQFLEFLSVGRETERQSEQPHSRYYASEHGSRGSNEGFAPEQPYVVPPRRVQSSIHLPASTSFESCTDQPTWVQPLASDPSVLDTCQAGDESLEMMCDRAQQEQDELLAALMLLRGNVRHVHAEIDDLQDEQSEHSEEVAAAWHGKRRQWLPLN